MFPSWLQSVWKIARATRPWPRLRRRELLILGGIALISALVTLAIMLSAAPRTSGSRTAESPAAAGTAGTARPPGASAEVTLSLSDFILPEPPALEKGPRYYQLRQRSPRWSREQVERYWVPPRDVAADVLGRANDKAMEEFFESLH